MSFDWIDLADVPMAELIALHRDPRVLRHLPLATGAFDAATCRAWVADKAAMWRAHGFGVRGIRIDGRFAGWGGLQPEAGQVGLALVLAPPFWGHGRAICNALLAWAFDELGLASVDVLLPPSRGRLQALPRLGFERVDAVRLAGRRFLRFRRWAGGCPPD
jgi:RimJ/RimL family protein N-acetyltransferase